MKTPETALAPPAGDSLVQLMAHLEQHREALGHDGMVAAYEAWLGRHPGPEGVGARFNLGALMQTAGRLEEAERCYQQVIQSMDLPQARLNLALLLQRCQRGAEARQQWRHVAASAAEPALRRQALAAWLDSARRSGEVPALCEALAASLAFDPAQADLQAELNLLQMPAPASGEASIEAKADPVVFVLAVCFNEAAILPFFLEHYIRYVGARKVVLHDGGSTDGSAEIAARYPEVDFIVAPSEKLDDRELMRIRNEAWKPYRDQCDWMIVGDVDEFLYHPDMRNTLRGLKQQGITLPMVEGFNILSKALPRFVPGRQLWQERQTGVADPRYGNKNLIFDPAIDINYTLGCHGCQPTGPVRRSAGFVFRSLHMSSLSYQHVIDKSSRSAARLSDWNKQTNAGFHYRINARMSRAEYHAKWQGAVNALHTVVRPTAQRQGLEAVLAALLQLDLDAQILEVGIAGGFGAWGDSGSTAFFAWYVHQFGGRLLSLETDARMRRHAQAELARAGLLSERVSLLAGAPGAEAALPGEPFDLVYFNAADDYGDAQDRVALRRQALLGFLDLEPRLAPHAMVAVDGLCGPQDREGKFSWLAQLLVGRGYQAQPLGDTTLFKRVD